LLFFREKKIIQDSGFSESQGQKEGEKLQKGGSYLERDLSDVGFADTLRRVVKVTVPCGWEPSITAQEEKP
jgi:hypothetical protein